MLQAERRTMADTQSKDTNCRVCACGHNIRELEKGAKCGGFIHDGYDADGGFHYHWCECVDPIHALSWKAD
jgi:hypothetical protein